MRFANPIPDKTAPVLAQHYGYTPEEDEEITKFPVLCLGDAVARRNPKNRTGQS